jgi:hypothetical protein
MGNTLYWVGYLATLTVFDTLFTARRIKKFGADVEQNWLIKKAVNTFGVEKGLLLAKVAPTAITYAALVKLGLHDAIVFLAGASSLVTLFQLMSLPMEDKIFAALDIKATSQVDASRPPSPTEPKLPLWSSVKAWLYSLYLKVKALWKS